MKCKNCGGVDFVKFASHYECVCCGQKWVDDTAPISSPVEENANLANANPNEALYKTLIGYTDQVRMNEELMRVTVLEILKNDSEDLLAKCLLAYLDRDEYPENYKEAIESLSNVDLDEDTEQWICTFLIENSEYKYFDSIVDMLFNKNLYSDYSQLLVDAKNRLEMANENYSNIPRDVFVCYSSNDIKVVEKLVERLEADGSSCWYADRNMPQNSLLKTEYKTRIEEAISKCKVFLVVMSHNSLLSEDVNWELDAADDYGIDNRIEYRIEDAENTTRFKRFFDGIQWIDASNETQYHTLLSRVYDMLHPVEDVDDEDESGNKTVFVTVDLDDVSFDGEDAFDEDEDMYDDDDDIDEESPNKTVLSPMSIDFDVDSMDFDSDTDIKVSDDVEAQALELFDVEEYDKAFALLDEVEEPSFGNLTNFYIGLCFENGYGTDIDTEQAKYFYNLAENGEDIGDEEQLGKCFYFLAMKYARGEFFSKDERKAFELFEKAADYRNGNAIFNLGICYKTGKGTEQNYEEAFACFMNAARYIPEEANYQIALCLDEGLGTTKDPEQAVEYYREAAELGNTKAMTNLGMHYYYGNGVDQDYDEAVRWYREAAESGNAIAQYNLGQCYFGGTGVEQDLDFARDWFERSAKNGNKKAAHFIIDNF